MNTYHAAHWSDISYSSSEEDEDKRYRITHHQRTKQRGNGQQHQEQRYKEEWTWEDILDGKGCYTWEEILAGRDRLPWEQVEAARRAEAAGEGNQWYEGTRLARKPERQPPIFWVGVTHGNVAESGWRPEPTPRAYRGEDVTGQAPCYRVM